MSFIWSCLRLGSTSLLAQESVIPNRKAPRACQAQSILIPQVGDQILEVNGRSFLSIPHDEAVKLLKSSRHLIMTVKDIGRLPHARTTVDETRWISSSQLGETLLSSAGFVPTEILGGSVSSEPLGGWGLSMESPVLGSGSWIREASLVCRVSRCGQWCAVPSPSPLAEAQVIISIVGLAAAQGLPMFGTSRKV